MNQDWKVTYPRLHLLFGLMYGAHLLCPMSTIELRESLSPVHGEGYVEKTNDALFPDDFRSNRSKGILLDELFKIRYMKEILYISGLYFPLNYGTGNWQIRLQRLWAFCNRLFLLWTNGFAVDGSNRFGFQHHDSLALRLLFTLCMITIILQSLVLVPSFFRISNKLHQPCLMIDVEQYPKCFTVCLVVFSISILSGLVGVIFPILYLWYYNDLPTFVILTMTEIIGTFCVSVFLTANIMMIAVDANVACSLLDMLTERAKNQTLTLKLFKDVREEIQSRVKASYWESAVVIVAILDIMVMVLILLLVPLLEQKFTLIFVVLMCIYFLKEVPFLFVVLMQSAQVNDKSDKLTRLLGTISWRKSGDEESASREDNDRELRRLTLFANAEAHKISMPLAWMRFKRRDIFVRFGLWGLSLVIGIVKTIVDSSVNIDYR